MEIRVESVEFFERPTQTRLPFHFGAVTMRSATTLIARVRASAEGAACQGFAADLLVPKWFDKDPTRSAAQNEADLKESARLAAEQMIGLNAASPFELWRQTYAARQAVAATYPGGGLAVGFGVALVERALLDAACRGADMNFFDAWKSDLFEYKPGLLNEALRDWKPAQTLASQRAQRIQVRHTIGMLDPLERADRAVHERINDHLPETLVEDIEHYGLSRFKVKLGGEPAADLARLTRLAELLPELCGASDWSMTLDANEQYGSTEPLAKMLDELAERKAGAALLERLRFIEQPIPRVASFETSLREPFDALRRHAPCIIDEADADLTSFPRAIECGWRGVSVKACKGVFRAMTNRGLCEISGGEHFQSGEDLTNLPVLPLQQDLTLATTLGLEDVERNGHHYFRGLDHLPESEAASALQSHDSLYHRIDGGIALSINAGSLDLRSLDCVGFGYLPRIELTSASVASVQRSSHRSSANTQATEECS
ncbi:MAG: hypothetical protein ACI841_001490 [Planctomycetota bacterium]|jgi:hypothetical protein